MERSYSSAEQPARRCKEMRRSCEAETHTSNDQINHVQHARNSKLTPSRTEHAARHAAWRLGQNADITLIIHYLQPRERAEGIVALVCQNWRAAHRQHAWEDMVLQAGLNQEGFDAIGVDDDWTLQAAHASVQSFVTRPTNICNGIAQCATSLTLKIFELSALLDYHEQFSVMPFKGLQRLVIDGCMLTLPLRGVDGLRLGLMFSTLRACIKTLILKVNFVNEDDAEPDTTMATIVSMFPNLHVLDIPLGAVHQLQRGQISPMLECCQGLHIAISDLERSWLAEVPLLKQLHICICTSERTSPTKRHIYDCTSLFDFLEKKCPQLAYLHLEFAGYGTVQAEAFRSVPNSCKTLVLIGLDVRDIDSEQPALESSLAAEYNAVAVCKHLRQKLHDDCKLYVLKQDYLIDVEKPRKLISNPQYAAAA